MAHGVYVQQREEPQVAQGPDPLRRIDDDVIQAGKRRIWC